MIDPRWVWVLAGLLGALFGSFWNVAIHRWPRGLSVLHPSRSHCPGCGEMIAARHNVPVLSYVLLRGRSACCDTPISSRYPVVELLGMVLAVALVRTFAISHPGELGEATVTATGLQAAAVLFVFVGGLVIATFVDLQWMRIPDGVTLPGTALGLCIASLRFEEGWFEHTPLQDVELPDLLVGAGAGFLWVQVVFVWLYERVLGRRGMGEGDAKLLMFIGIFVGWRGVLFSLVAGSVQGLLGAVLMFRGKSGQGTQQAETQQAGGKPTVGTPMGTRRVPFGPFLSLSALEYLFFADWIHQGMEHLFGF